MRKVSYLSLLLLCLAQSISSQQSAVTQADQLNIAYLVREDFDATPPKLLPPVFGQDGDDDILFTWEQAGLPLGATVEYELILKGKNGLVFSKRSFEAQVTLKNASTVLEEGESYQIELNCFVTEADRSTAIRSKEQKSLFVFVPKCTAPVNLRVARFDEYGMTVAWDGSPGKTGETEYLVRFWPSDQPDYPSEERVTEGNEFYFFAPATTVPYTVEVIKICFWKDGSELRSAVAGMNTAGLGNDFPAQCGDHYDFPPCTGPFYETGNWSSLSVGGFPIIVLTNAPAPTGGWNGTGRIRLPFGSNKYVKVQWSGVSINLQGKICGTVTGIRDVPPNLPDLNGGPAIWGDEICQDPPSACGFNAQGIHCETGQPWDPYGFNQDSLYVQQPPYEGWQPGMPYDSLLDPNGFNSEGIHFETGTQYGPNGCSQQGFDEQGQPCQVDSIPYYWLQDNPAESAEALEFYEEVEDSLHQWVQNMLAFWINTSQDTIDQISSECQSIRTDMEGLIVALNYSADRELIFGPGDIYFETGMWKHFDEGPKILNVEVDRDPSQVDLEAKHVDLYHCDKKLDTYAVFNEIVDSLNTNAGISDLVVFVQDLILNLSTEEAEAFAEDIPALKAWIKEKMRDHISSTFCDGTCFLLPKTSLQAPTPQENQNLLGGLDRIISSPKPSFDIELLNKLIHPPGSLASVGQEQQLLQIFGAKRPEEILTAYLNGDQVIHGVDRAFYLEAIGEARASAYPLTAANPELMPIAISNLPTDGRTYSIWLDNIEFTATNAVLDAYFVLEFPNSGKKIVFSALDVPFTPNGFFDVPAIKLQLANDVELRLNNAVKLTLQAGDSTYVAFNCNGYGGIGINFDVEVCRKYVKPLDPTTLAVLPDPARVHTHFYLFLATLDELYFEVNIDPFVVTGIEDYKWLVDGIVVDFSDTKSPANLPPPGYLSPFANGNGFSPLWRGIYLAQLEVQMPNQFSNSGVPQVIGVQKVLIDNMGFSGIAYKSPLLALNEGNAGGWAFSVDEFQLTVLANQLASAGFKGKIHVPLFSAASSNCNTGTPVSNDCFNYDAFIEPNPLSGTPTYRMTVNTGGSNWCVNMWKSGQVTVNSGSQINMLIENGQFKVEARLSGKVKITDPLNSNIDISIPDITFQNLVIRNQAPYFSPGTWGFPVPNQVGGSFGGFGLNISKIEMVDVGGNPALSFDAGFKITDDEIGLKADGSFLLKGQLNMVGGKQRWVYHDFDVKTITLNGSFPGVDKIQGTLTLFQGDATYGTGWRGGVKLHITQLAEVSAVAQFGRIKTPVAYKYFFVDALACLDKGFGGALKLKGIGGGVYYHMNRPAASLPLGTGCVENPTIPSGLGMSLSTLVYTPDNSKGLGIKATVAIASAIKESAFNGNATLELLFNSGGGLSDIWIYGNARFMEKPKLDASTDTIPPSGSAVAATLDIHLDFNNKVLHGELDVYLNAAGGVIHGGNPNDLLAHAVLHVETQQNGVWYIKIGSPTNRARLAIEIPFIGEIGNIGAYLQLGKDLDPMPSIPQEIIAITGASGSQSEAILNATSKRDGSNNGSGFIFGADLSVGDKPMDFLIFYATIRARIGFDISLLDYGENAICAQSGQQIGINGWYASGQVYAGLWGSIGIKVRVFGKNKRYSILSVGVAATLQASLPNPFWAEGTAGGEYDLLGGLIKGNCKFKVTIGERCQIIGSENPLGDLNVVQSITPEDKAQSVSVETYPQVAFNFPIGEQFELTDPNNLTVTYKATVDAVQLKHYSIPLPITVKWANDKRSLVIEPEYFLPGNDTVTVVVLSHVDSSGIRIYDEEYVVKYATARGLTYISQANVLGSYPYDGQFNFFPDQIQDRTGYILLKRSQSELFNTAQSNEKYLVRYKKYCGESQDVALNYNGLDDRVDFNIPQNFFDPGEIYRMQVLKISAIKGNESNNSANRPGGCLESQNAGESILYTAYFRVSQHNSFGAKLTAWNSSKQMLPYSGGIIKAQGDIEPFDEAEIGSNGGTPLIDLIANLSGSNWYNQKIKLIYQAFEDYKNYSAFNSEIKLNRTGDNYGTPPFKAIAYKVGSNSAPAPKINQQHWVNGPAGLITTQLLTMEYMLPKVFKQDYDDLMDDISNLYTNQMDEYSAQEQIDIQQGIYIPCSGDLCNGCSNVPYPSSLTDVYCVYPNFNSLNPPAGDYTIVVRYRKPGTTAWLSEQVLKLQKN